MAAAVWTLGESTIRQGDVEFQDRAVALVLQFHLDLLLVDRYVLADHFQQVFLQLGQIIRLCALATFVGNDDLQSWFSGGSAGVGFATAKEI